MDTTGARDFLACEWLRVLTVIFVVCEMGNLHFVSLSMPKRYVTLFLILFYLLPLPRVLVISSCSVHTTQDFFSFFSNFCIVSCTIACETPHQKIEQGYYH